MLQTVVTIAAICGMVQSSGVHHAVPIANAPVVTATSSQYFQRTFNRLVTPTVFVEPVVRPQQFVPVQSVPVQPATQLQPVPSFQSVLPVQPAQPNRRPQLLQPQQPQQPQPVEPNVAIAIATANAAAPVATILLPPYPFGFPSSFGLIPQEQPNDDRTKEETTTQNPTTQADVKNTREPESTTQMPEGSDDNAVQALPSNQDESQVNFRQYLAPSPLPSNQDVNFRQYAAPNPLPSNQDVNFRQYIGPNPQLQRPQHQLPLALPQPQPLPHHHHHHHHPHTHFHVHPQKLKTLVEVQRVPLAYIAPPPLPHFEHNHQAIKVIKHIHSFVPSRAKLIIRPVLKTRSISTNTGHKVPSTGYNVPSTGYNVPSTGYNVPSTGHKVPSTGYNVPSTGYNVPSTGYNVPSTGYNVPSTGYNVPSTRYNVPITGYNVPSTGYKAPAPLRNIAPRSQNARPFNTKEIEPTTFRPFPIPNTKPPRL